MKDTYIFLAYAALCTGISIAFGLALRIFIRSWISRNFDKPLVLPTALSPIPSQPSYTAQRAMYEEMLNDPLAQQRTGGSYSALLSPGLGALFRESLSGLEAGRQAQTSSGHDLSQMQFVKNQMASGSRFWYTDTNNPFGP